MFIFDHSYESGTYENLSDGDGFGIRRVIKIGEPLNEKERELFNTIRNGEESTIERLIDNAVSQVRSGRKRSSSGVSNSEGRGTALANGAVAETDDGEALGTSSGVLGDLESSGENRSGDSGRLTDIRAAAEETSAMLDNKSHLVDNIEDIFDRKFLEESVVFHK